ncbi:uncharacterized protein LOC116300538 [Actinia tenebrosa]|uniref:Uncharacterized protein LOC116300538 n=1 Tax=Actinia tenebrosa TaxID=6105 RepID=A0A6P8IEI0_ACTTE|nr:uncharacterized protein LOC116300538 [Actinia tenebrosa]
MIRNYNLSKTRPRTNKVPGQRDASVFVQKKFSTSQQSELLPAMHSCDRRGIYKVSKSGTSQANDSHSSLTKHDRGTMMVESIENFVNVKPEPPLSDVFCAGQQLEVRGEPPSNNTRLLDKSLGNSETFALGGQNDSLWKSQTQGTQSVALNKLYSSLNKLKSRHDTLTGKAIQRDVRSRCLAFPFKHCKGFGNAELGEEEIFILLGGKSKPVCFEVNPDNLNLLENEFGLKLKSKSITASSLDQEDYELLKKFREKYRTGVPRNESPFVPWARHAIFRPKKDKNTKTKDNDAKNRRDDALPCATYEVEEEDFGRKLSIHVYLPNVVAS